MNPLVDVRNFRFEKAGGDLSFRLEAGQVLATIGSAPSGSDDFLRRLAGLARGGSGTVRLAGSACYCGAAPLPRKSHPENHAKRFAGRGGASRAAEALAALRLWDDRKTPMGRLASEQWAACELLESFAGDRPIFLVNGQFDRLDPWARAGALELLRQRLREGACLVVATNDPAWVRRSDTLLIWRERRPLFAGTAEELERLHGPVRLEVESIHDEAVRALCDPFEVSIEERPDGLRISAREGQALSARLLTEGYGDVRAVVTRRPRPEEMLESFLATAPVGGSK